METTKRTYQKHKTEYKITVNHYINETILELNNGNFKFEYPIYVQVIHKSKSTKFRSKINPLNCDKVDSGEIGLDDLRESIIRDTAFIESLIKQLTNYNLTSEKDSKVNLNYLSPLYNFDNFRLTNFIDYGLRLEIVELIESNTGKAVPSIYDVKPSILLNFYLSKYPFLKSILDKFNSDIWIFDVYLEQINNLENYKSQERLTPLEISKMKITDFPRNRWKLTLQDFIDGYAQKLLLDYFDDSLKMKEIFLDIEKLISKYGKDYFEKAIMIHA